MKLKVIYMLFGIALSIPFFFASSSGPAAVQGVDRTGSPLGNGNCQSCHTAGAYAPTIEVNLLENGNAVNNYVPGGTYTLQVQINATSGTPSSYGFQAVALTGGDNVNAGTFGMPPSGVQVTNLTSRQYAEHSSPSSGNTFEIEWTAPAEGSGEVRFYAAGVAANGLNGSGGDGGVRLVDPLVITELASSSEEITDRLPKLSVISNPVRDQLNIRLDTPQGANYQLRLLDLTGRTLQQHSVNLSAGEQTLQFDTGNLTNGLYIVSLTDGREVASRRFVKR